MIGSADLEELKTTIQAHSGMNELKRFGENLKKNALNERNLKIFFATLWAFYRQTPSGILNLSLRVNDYWDKLDMWHAMAHAAYLLYAVVDEFGLDTRGRMKLTHHQLFKDAADYFNITPDELVSSKNILDAGKDIGSLSFEYYRHKSIPEGLGFHFASELTSLPEFECFLDGFWQHKDIYKFSSQIKTPLNFFSIHTAVEASHRLTSEIMLQKYFQVEA
ncbi:MAG: hypothetical protein EPO11_08490, partial [Gammaproteobacteria bacterium]